jgi:5-methylcytosine-specific restriction protein A
MPCNKKGQRRWLALYEYKKIYPEDNILFPQPDYRISPDTCKWCGGKLPPKRKSFCSDGCASDFRHYTVWGGRGQSPLAYRILCRDNFTCQRCGRDVAFTNEHGMRIPTAKDGEVHHKDNVSNGGTDHQSNLITLCSECHKAEHSKAG